MNDGLTARLTGAALQLADSASMAGWRGPDAYDGLWWDWPDRLVAGRRRRQVLMQLHARSPVDIRKLYRRRHPLIPKALGIFGSVGIRAHSLNGSSRARTLGLAALEELADDRTAGPVAWGYHWDMQTRWSYYRAGSPNVVVTAFGSSGLLEAKRLDLSRRALEAAQWVLDELWVEPEGYFAYHPGRPTNIHNANLLGAWLVHVVLGEDPGAAERVQRAVARTLAAQRPDGSWPYGEGGNLGWVDSFHTGYVLTCLARLASVSHDVGGALERGARHYQSFFDSTGRAKLWADRHYPEDAHAAGTGLTTLAILYRLGLVERERLEPVARRVLDAGIRDGHAVYRRYPWGRTTVRYLRWADAHVALGCVDAAAALAGKPDPAPASQPGLAA
jgi:hypothetical protein